MRSGTICGMAGTMACLAAPLSYGEILTFAMEASVTSIQNPTGALDWVSIDDRVVYTFTFDSDAPDESPALSQGVYSFLSSTLSVAGQITLSTPRVIGIQHPLDTFDVLSDITLPGLANSIARFRLNDQLESNALMDTSLPTVPYDLALFETSSFLIQGLGPPVPPDTYPSISSFSGLIHEFYIVPEPASAALLFALGFLRNRRRR